MNGADKKELAQMVDEIVTKRVSESEGRILADMKQFTTATVAQQTSDIREDIKGIHDDVSGIQQDLTRIEQKVDDIAVGMGEALDVSNEVVDEQLKDHEGRLLRLEKRAA